MDLAELVQAVRAGNMLAAREWLKEATRRHLQVADLLLPAGGDETARSLSAGLAELLALRLGGTAPAWTAAVGAAPQELWLVESARRHPALAERCRLHGPEPLRRRRIMAFPEFLSTA